MVLPRRRFAKDRGEMANTQKRSPREEFRAAALFFRARRRDQPLPAAQETGPRCRGQPDGLFVGDLRGGNG